MHTAKLIYYPFRLDNSIVPVGTDGPAHETACLICLMSGSDCNHTTSGWSIRGGKHAVFLQAERCQLGLSTIGGQ